MFILFFSKRSTISVWVLYLKHQIFIITRRSKSPIAALQHLERERAIPAMLRLALGNLSSPYDGSYLEFEVLVVFHQAMIEHPDTFGTTENLEILRELVESRQTELRGGANPVGQLIYAEKAKDFNQRMHKYWQVWRAL